MKKSDFKLEMDAQVFLRIAQHAKQNYPAAASGSLLGLDQENTARVSNCFAFQRKETMEESAPLKEKADFMEYQYGMLRALSEIRVEANAVGWYESTHYGNFLTEAFIENAYLFQKEVPNSVVVVYNPYMQKLGKCGFQAFRLTDKAMQVREENQTANEDDTFAGLSSDEILEEVEILCRMNVFTETMLLQLGKEGEDFAGLDMKDSTDGQGRTLSLLLDSLDEFSAHQRDLSMFERQSRAMKEKQSKQQRVPKSGDTVSLARQVVEHSRSLTSQQQDYLAKLHLLSGATLDTESIINATQGA